MEGGHKKKRNLDLRMEKIGSHCTSLTEKLPRIFSLIKEKYFLKSKDVPPSYFCL